jgi:sRNA-binding protein
MSKRTRTRAAIALIGNLAEAYPQAFFVLGKQRRPLKVGIHADIMAARPDIEPRQLGHALMLYVASFR